MNKLLIATQNPGKVQEYKLLFAQLQISLQLVFLEDLGIQAKVEEDGRTFKENAVKKAEFYSKLSGLPTLGDDGGLEIDYLNGEPGVKSRRWPGYEATDEELISLAMEKLRGIPSEKRGAQMRDVIALALPEGKIYTFQGIIRGTILEKPLKKIIPGFPFRAIFYVASKKSMLGEKGSHRQRALKKALPILKKYYA